MFRKKTGDYLDKCSILLHGYKLFAVLLLAFGMAACDDDNTVPEPDPEPTSTFKLHIGEGNIVPMDLGAPDNYPPAYMAVLVMEDLPADEKIIYEGSVYSTENPEPDLSDCVFINDYSDYEPFLNWDWEKEPLYWRCLYLLHPAMCRQTRRSTIPTRLKSAPASQHRWRRTPTPTRYPSSSTSFRMPKATIRSRTGWYRNSWTMPIMYIATISRERRALCGRHHRARRYAA